MGYNMESSGDTIFSQPFANTIIIFYLSGFIAPAVPVIAFDVKGKENCSGFPSGETGISGLL